MGFSDLSVILAIFFSEFRAGCVDSAPNSWCDTVLVYVVVKLTVVGIVAEPAYAGENVDDFVVSPIKIDDVFLPAIRVTDDLHKVF